MDGNFYYVKYRCSNCLHGYMVKIPYKQEALINLECLVCGLDKVNKTDKYVEWMQTYTLENERLVQVKNGK
jgi:hypothetical protein